MYVSPFFIYNGATHFYETYPAMLSGYKGSDKGYFEAALSHQNNLMQSSYDNGLQSMKVFANDLPKIIKVLFRLRKCDEIS